MLNYLKFFSTEIQKQAPALKIDIKIFPDRLLKVAIFLCAKIKIVIIFRQPAKRLNTMSDSVRLARSER